MPVTFGFSVADFLGSIDLLVDAVKSLRNTNGARYEYKELSRELKHLKHGLECIQIALWTLHNRSSSQLLMLHSMTASCVLMILFSEMPDSKSRLTSLSNRKEVHRSSSA